MHKGVTEKSQRYIVFGSFSPCKNSWKTLRKSGKIRQIGDAKFCVFMILHSAFFCAIFCLDSRDFNTSEGLAGVAFGDCSHRAVEKGGAPLTSKRCGLIFIKKTRVSHYEKAQEERHLNVFSAKSEDYLWRTTLPWYHCSP